jgi:hypothetical protein
MRIPCAAAATSVYVVAYQTSLEGSLISENAQEPALTGSIHRLTAAEFDLIATTSRSRRQQDSDFGRQETTLRLSLWDRDSLRKFV